ncbi:MAG: S8 family serine peptidase [Microthrixaceae bacterium]
MALVALVVLVAGCGGTGGSSGREDGNGAPVASASDGTPGRSDTEGQSFYVVVFDAYPDLDRIAAIADRTTRGRALVEELRTTATTSQAEARRVLREQGVEFRELWLANAIALCTCDRDVVDRLRGLDGVRAVIGGADARVDAADDEPVFPGAAPSASPALDALGVSALRARPGAPDGSGVTVGVIDTGVDGAHPALAAGYRGAPTVAGRAPTHDRNWFDPYSRCRTPCDPQGHGTHVTSVAVGRAVPADPGSAGSAAGGYRPPAPAVPAVGVAPGATWIAARGCTGAVCDLDELLAALQFMVAPTDRDGADPDPDLRPDVLVNSWGLTSPNPALERAQRAVEASGIIPVAAAGNHGPACGSVTTPGSHRTTLTVGALGRDRRPLPMSGRGPGPTDSQPNVAAVGQEVPGALPDRSWGTMTGTSQAAPQVAGLAALLLQASPSLRGDFPEVERRIDSSATPVPDDSCGLDPGDPRYNNVTGTGLPDALRLLGG